MRAVRLAHATDFVGFRAAARVLVQAGLAPAEVAWCCGAPGAGGEDLFESAAPHAGAEGPPAGLEGLAVQGAAPAVPSAFLADCERLVLHRDPARFDLMYRLLWRHVHEPGLRHDALDADRQLARHMVHAVARDMHKMRAFVRFRPVQEPGGGTVHAAWFEPEHHTVRANADFFVRRFAGMRWAILTPECSLRWDGAALHTGPGGQRSDAPPPDAGEALWLTYYRHIFSPARLKLDMMRKEMPRRYWRNLPEAALIGELAQSALQRSARMVAAEPSQPGRRIVPIDTQRAPAAVLRLDGHSDEPNELARLHAAAEQCRACPIGAHATQAVPGAGPIGAARMLVGEQPGDQEDLCGQAFVGPAGQLLDRALAQLAWPREALYLTNAVKHFKYQPRGKRRLHQRPSVGDLQACSQFLDREIALVAPRQLIALGATAARALLGYAVQTGAVRGGWHSGRHGLPVLVVWHPAALLRAPDGERAAMWRAWLQDLAAPLPEWALSSMDQESTA